MKVENVVINKQLYSRKKLNKKFVDTILHVEKKKQNQISLQNSDKIVCC